MQKIEIVGQRKNPARPLIEDANRNLAQVAVPGNFSDQPTYWRLYLSERLKIWDFDEERFIPLVPIGNMVYAIGTEIRPSISAFRHVEGDQAYIIFYPELIVTGASTANEDSFRKAGRAFVRMNDEDLLK